MLHHDAEKVVIISALGFVAHSLPLVFAPTCEPCSFAGAAEDEERIPILSSQLQLGTLDRLGFRRDVIHLAIVYLTKVSPRPIFGYMEANVALTDYSATIEYLGNGAAIVAIFDSRGEWVGAGRVEVRSRLRSDLYEAGYRHASLSAMSKGGRLGRFSVTA